MRKFASFSAIRKAKEQQASNYYTLEVRFYTIGETMSILSEIFGDCPQAKIIEAFAEHHEDKLYVADIVRITGVSKSTVYKHLRKLIAEGVVEEKGSAGNIKFYQLNPRNPKAKIVLSVEKFIASERLGTLVDVGSGEKAGQNLKGNAYGDEKAQHLVPEKNGGSHKEAEDVEEETEYIDSYGIEAASTADGETYLIGNFESFEDAKDFLKSELNHFETVNARIIRHTERTSEEAIFTDRIEDFFYHKPPSWDSQI